MYRQVDKKAGVGTVGVGYTLVGGGYCPGAVSSIHFLLDLLTAGTVPELPLTSSPPSSSLGLVPFGRAGHGRMEDADTVNTAPTAVRKKRDERADRRVLGVIRRDGSGFGMAI